MAPVVASLSVPGWVMEVAPRRCGGVAASCIVLAAAGWRSSISRAHRALGAIGVVSNFVSVKWT
ncbi:hypothetical protein E2562_003807 [Oryza meyeriana var. granulata]|uniref:Uncharacterized protein n=1 Tax=Oryza meyeriana var. granulata TaxID=110450 RepID=A0A6G1BS87_9ORYZ|nr:hypothetical protein E2562_003807 [Oryza meyeriana var. granulata]